MLAALLTVGGIALLVGFLIGYTLAAIPKKEKMKLTFQEKDTNADR